MNTNHYQYERSSRENLIANTIGEGIPLFRFLVDRNHPNGNEWHTITNTGIIVITNARTGKVCSKEIARPAQLTRYTREDRWYGQVLLCENMRGEVVRNPYIPQYLVNIARKHQLLGYNNR